MKTMQTVDRLTDPELVGLVLGMAPDTEAVVKLATAMATDSWLAGLPLTEIARECRDIGDRRIERLEAGLELGRRAIAARAAYKGTMVCRPEDAADLIRPMISDDSREHFFAILLDIKNKVKQVVLISVGSLNASIVHPRELFKQAVRLSAASVVVVHNHPSGDATPSGADVSLTRRLMKAGDVLGIELLDHVVVTSGGFVSLRDTGLM